MRRLLHYRLILLHYRAVITLPGDYYIIGCNRHVLCSNHQHRHGKYKESCSHSRLDRAYEGSERFVESDELLENPDLAYVFIY